MEINCDICGKILNRKPSWIKKNKRGNFCSVFCRTKYFAKYYLGLNNPNNKFNFDHSFFKNIDSEEKAYLLGWIASDGNISKSNSIGIRIRDYDSYILETLKNFICPEIKIKIDRSFMRKIEFNSKEFCEDISHHLGLDFSRDSSKKSHIVQFPEIESEFLTWAFIRGYFDGDGTVGVIDKKRIPRCSIASNSLEMLKGIRDFCGIPAYLGKHQLEWSGTNAIDFLGKIYDNAKYRLARKYNRYIDFCMYEPAISGFRKKDGIVFTRIYEEAVYPTKNKASDSGYDITLIKPYKTFGPVTLYSTGIKVKPPLGYYFILVPRSSITKSGYMLANSIGIIDRSYVGEILVALTKIRDDVPDLILPNKLVQIIPKKIQHFELIEVDSFDDETTSRGEGGFGSSDKN